MKEEETTRSKIKGMLEGMLYHCSELSSFMSKNNNDPYFETEEGKRIHKYVLGILINHVMALMKFRTFDDAEKENKSNELEDLLKDSFE